MKDSKIIKISPRWDGICIMGCLLALCVYMSITDATVPRHGLPMEILCICIGIVIVLFSCAYTLNARGISVRLFGIVLVRKILWEEVNQVLLFKGWTYQNRTIPDTKMIITFRGCETFVPGLDNPSDFVPKHPLRSFGILIPPADVAEKTAALKELCPNMEEFIYK